MEKLVRTLLASFFLLGFASAQDIPRLTVFGGVSYLSYDNATNPSSLSNRLSMIGVDSSVAYHLWHRFSAEADIGYHMHNSCPGTSNDATCKDFSFMAGPRYTFGSGSGRISPFV